MAQLCSESCCESSENCTHPFERKSSAFHVHELVPIPPCHKATFVTRNSVELSCSQLLKGDLVRLYWVKDKCVALTDSEGSIALKLFVFSCVVLYRGALSQILMF